MAGDKLKHWLHVRASPWGQNRWDTVTEATETKVASVYRSFFRCSWSRRNNTVFSPGLEVRFTNTFICLCIWHMECPLRVRSWTGSWSGSGLCGTQLLIRATKPDAILFKAWTYILKEMKEVISTPNHCWTHLICQKLLPIFHRHCFNTQNNPRKWALLLPLVYMWSGWGQRCQVTCPR